MLHLRDYQQECLDVVQRERERGLERLLCVLPTGTGKTVVFAHQIKQTKGKSLILVHREELLQQAKEKLLIVDPTAEIGIVKAERNEMDAQVTIASVQSLSRANRLTMAAEQHYELIVTDEAHHAVASSYGKIYDALLNSSGGSQLHLGFTATPNRADCMGLGKVYQKVAFFRGMLEMIKSGWLCNLRCIQVQTKVSLSGVHTRAGDFAVNELASVVDTANRNDLIVDSYQKHADGKLALCFTVNVAHAVNLAEAFQKKGVKAVALSGQTSADERRSMIERFHDHEIDVICNCQVLTEGFDAPAIECIMLARPTKSSMMFMQMVGRGTRTFPGKKDCLVLDVSDNVGRHSVIQLPDLIGLEKTHVMDGSQTLTEMEYAEKHMADIVGTELVSEETNLFASSDLVWIDLGKSRYLLSMGDAGKMRVIPHPKQHGKYTVFHQDKVLKPHLLTEKPVPLTWALGIADAKAHELAQGSMALISKKARWRQKPASEKQLNILRKNGIEYSPSITMGEASSTISKLFESGSRSIKTVLKDLKPKEPKQLSFLDQLKKGNK